MQRAQYIHKRFLCQVTEHFRDPMYIRFRKDVFSKNTRLEVTRHSTYVWITVRPCFNFHAGKVHKPARSRATYLFIHIFISDIQFVLSISIENYDRTSQNQGNLDADKNTSSNQNYPQKSSEKIFEKNMKIVLLITYTKSASNFSHLQRLN